ncbi:DUF5696 domain-containing protein [Paenibacillus dakarensis]|uniref:DUF5696 domain-containing protein n=1 Tax=Paenibacillus dakarensis TaxID=1527293 RepID=UPI0006D581C7|nr:DUF5696 domain-containing protein [Paenibacillus dakarensis]
MRGKSRKAAGLLCLLLTITVVVAGLGGIGADSGNAALQEGVKPTAGKAEPRTSAVGVSTSAKTSAAAEKENRIVSPNTPAELQALETMEQVADNETLQLYMNRQTAEIAVKDTRDGYVWFSNPVGRDEDPLASPMYKSELSAQVLIQYYNEKGQINTFNSYDDSVAKEQFEMTAENGKVRAVYRIGNVAKSFANIPKVIGKERFENEILAKIQDEEVRDGVAYKYRLIEERQVYEVRKLQDYVAEELSQILEQAGYTADDAAADHKENGVAGETAEESAEFTVVLEYSLDGENLVVTVPGRELTYNKAYPLASLQVLKFFGAAGTNDKGYILVPDGSGALIRLNSGKPGAEPYRLPVYGRDGTFMVKEQIQQNQITRLPVFGMKRNDHAFIGMIEEGDAAASVTADVSGRNDSYNTVSSQFQVTAMDMYTLTSGTKSSSVPMFQQRIYDGNLQLRFGFLSGQEASYTGMAEHYRNYLIGMYGLTPLQPQEHSPFILELAGAFRKNQSFLGIPYKSTEPLTTFNQAVELMEKLKQAGVGNINLRLVGWFNDGINHSSPNDISVESVLGGKKDLGELASYAEKNGIGLFPDAAFLRKYKGDGGAATLLDRKKAKKYAYNPVTYNQDLTRFSHYVLSPSRLSSQVDGFLKDYTKLQMNGLALRDMGDEVNSDFNPDRMITRPESQQIIVEQLEKLRQSAGNIMVSGGNAYSLPYADVVVNAPTRSSRLNLTDEDVPFYQIVLHGYIDLAGAPFNMDEDQNPRLSMLKALETGSNLYYEWFYSPASVVKDTEFNVLYAASYKDWLDEATELYKEADEVLSKVRTQTITDHENLQEGVVRTTFSGGMSILINYNPYEIVVDGKTLASLSWQAEEGGE